jgi:hypothetical protein
VKNCGVAQGYLETLFPCTSCLYNISKKTQVATTETIEPILDIKFQPAKASG